MPFNQRSQLLGFGQALCFSLCTYSISQTHVSHIAICSCAFCQFAMESSSPREGRQQKLQKLDDFKRKLPHVSASALAAILKEVKEDGPPELGTRKQIKEATQNALSNDAYGPMISCAEVTLVNGATQKICFVNPLTLLATAVGQDGAFSILLKESMEKHDCSFDAPFKILLYADEVVAGNPLAHTTGRKVWVFYMSLLDLGPLMLQKEQAWFTVMVQRSSTVSTFASGISQLYKIILRSIFFSPECSVKNGMALKFPDGSIKHLFLAIGGIIQDGGAHKFTWSGKGDAGTKFCILCKNLVSLRSNLVNQDGEALLTTSMHSVNDLAFASNDDIFASIDVLAKKKDTLSAQQFKLWEQASGFIFEPNALLFDKELREYIFPVDHFIHDYMHCILCNGVMATVLTLLLNDIENTKLVDAYGTLGQYVEFWHLPKAKAASLAVLFSAKKKKANKDANTFKATASEFLSLYPIIAYFMQKAWMPGGLCVAQCQVFVELGNLLDMLQAIPVCNITPQHLQCAVKDLFSSLVHAGWVGSFHSKFHWLVHSPAELGHLKCLPSCFTHERKHRLVKRFLQNVTNTTSLEKGVLSEVVAQDLFEARHSGTFSTTARLEKQSQASRQLISFLSKYMTFEICYTSASLLLHPVGRVCKGDFALYKDDSSFLQAGEVWFHCELDGRLWTLMSACVLEEYSAPTCSALWSKTGSTFLLDSNCILCPLTWKEHKDNQLVTLIPMQFRPGS